MESIYLMGSETVDNASQRMARAAQQMHDAAVTLDTIFATHILRLNDWLDRFESVLDKQKESK